MNEAAQRFAERRRQQQHADDPIAYLLGQLRINDDVDSVLDGLLDRHQSAQRPEAVDAMTVRPDDLYNEAANRFEDELSLLQDSVAHAAVAADALLTRRSEITGGIEQQKTDLEKTKQGVAKALNKAGFDDIVGNTSLRLGGKPNQLQAGRQFTAMVAASPLCRRIERDIDSAKAEVQNCDRLLETVAAARDELRTMLELKVESQRG